MLKRLLRIVEGYLLGLACIAGMPAALFGTSTTTPTIEPALTPMQVATVLFTNAAGFASAPSIGTDGTLYIGGWDGKVHAFAIDRTVTPKALEKWRFQTGKPVTGSILVQPDSIYFGSLDGAFYAVDLNGQLRWKRHSSYDNMAFLPALGLDGKIYAGFFSSLYAFLTTGQTVWEKPLTNVASTPVIGHDGAIYVNAEKLFAFQPSGASSWIFEPERPLGFQGIGSAIGRDGTSYQVATWGNTSYLIAIHADGSVQWAFNPGVSLAGTPVIGADGTIYLSGHNGKVYAVHPNGSLKWNQSFGETGSFSLIALQGSLLLVNTSEGKVLEVGTVAADGPGSVLYTSNLEPPLTEPVVAPDGVIYIGSGQGKLYMLAGGSSTSSDGWPMFGHDAQRTGRAASTVKLPEAPARVTASQRVYPSKVLIEWTNASLASSYEVWRSTNSNPTTASFLASNFQLKTIYFDNTAQPGVNYYYWVKGRNLAGASGFSVPAQGSAALSGPGEPWETRMPGPVGYSSPAVAANGTIYIGSLNGPDRPDAAPRPGKLYAMSSAGQKQWEFSPSLGIPATPAVAPDGSIYFCSLRENHPEGVFYALASDGTKKWELAVPHPVQGSPALGADGTIYFGAGEVALNARNPDGTKKWDLTLGSPALSSPVIGADGTIYVGSANYHLNAVSPDGQLKWSVSIAGGASGLALGTDGTIYCTGRSDGITPLPGAGLSAVNPDGSLRWFYPAPAGSRTSPAIASDGAIYFGALDGVLHAVDRSGHVRWTYKTPGAIESSPAIGADGRIYFGSNDHKLYVLNADGSLHMTVMTQSPVRSSPAIGLDAKVHFGSDDGTLHSLKASSPGASGFWPMLGHDLSRSGRDSATAAAPTAPTGLAVSQGPDHLSLAWNPVSGSPSYEVWRSRTAASSEAVRIAQFLADPRYADADAAAGTTYYYWVKARNGSGISAFSETASGSRPAPAPGGVLWSYETPLPIRAGAALGLDGTVYAVNVSTNDPATGSHYLYAFDPKGSLKWEFLLDEEGRIPTAPVVSPAGAVYVGSSSGHLYAIGPDGTRQWTFTTQPLFGGFAGIPHPPALGEDGTIYFGGQDQVFYAVKADGTLKWSREIAPIHSSSPVSSSPVVRGDGVIYIAAHRTVVAFNADGTELWRYANVTNEPFATSPAIGADGVIYIGSNDRHLHAIHTDGTLKWKYEAGDVLSASAPVIGNDGVIYFGCRDGKLYAVNPDGTAKWTSLTGGPITTTPALGADGTVYIGSEDKHFYAITPNGQMAWRVPTDGAIHSHPVLSLEPVIYFGSDDGAIYFVRTAAPLAQSAWPMFQHDAQHHGRTAVMPAPPIPPSGVTASDGTIKGGVRITWNSAPWATSYEIWRSEANNPGPLTRIAENITGTTAYTDVTARFEVSYRYMVHSKNSFGVSMASGSDTGFQNFTHWTFDAKGHIRSTPAIGTNGTIYFGTVNVGGSSPGTFFAVDKNGVKLWEFASGGVFDSPSLGEDGTIYFGTSDRKLYALRPDGTKKWEFTARDSIDGTPAIGGGGTIYFGSRDRRLYALNPDGTKLWEFQLNGFISASPVVGRDGTIYLGTEGAVFFAINSNGTLKWSFPLRNRVQSSAAIGADGTIYFGSDRLIYALSPEGTKKWEYLTRGAVTSSPVIGLDGVIYAASGDGRLYALNPDGSKKWDAPLQGWSESAAAIGADGLIYAASPGGLFAFDQRGTNLWELLEVGSVIKSSPVLASDGTLYIGTHARGLQALKTGGAGLANSPWPMAFRDYRHTSNLAPPPAPPTLPANLSASSGNYIGNIRIHLGENPSATTFEIWRSTNSALTTASLIASNLIGVAYYDDRSVQAGSSFYYWVRARNIIGTSDFSQPLTGSAALQTKAWEFALPQNITTTVSLAPDQTAYVGGNDGELYAISPQGTLKWTYHTGARIFHPPVVAPDGTLYMVYADLYALNPDGTLKWRSDTAVYDFVIPGLAADGTIYCAHDKDLLAFNAEGKLRWRFETGATIYGAPAIGRDGTLYFGSGDSFYALNPDGTQKWRQAVNTELRTTPAIDADGTIYLSASDKRLYAFNSDGTIKWQFGLATSADGAPTIGINGNILVGGSIMPRPPGTTHEQRYPLYSVSPDGVKQWEYISSAMSASTAHAADGSIYLSDRFGLTALTAHGNVRWSLLIGTNLNSANAPAIGDTGRVYFGAGRTLYAIEGGSKLAESPWPSYRGNSQLTGRIAEGARLPLRLSNLQSGNGNLLRFKIQGNPGQRVMVQTSSNLLHWTDFTTLIPLSSGTFEFATERNGNEGTKFYRVVAPAP